MKIENLNFSVRVYNCLKRARVDTVEQLERMSDDDLLMLRNFGATCLAEVRQKVGRPKMTNGDRIRKMTDEELAKFLIGVEVCESQPLDKCAMASNDFCEACILDWLQRPSEKTHEKS